LREIAFPAAGVRRLASPTRDKEEGHVRKRLSLGIAVASLALVGVALAAAGFTVVPGVFDPSGTKLVQSRWLDGIGCPTAARLSDGTTYTDPACTTGDTSDHGNQGLLLVKTGPTTNNASAFAVINGVRGPLTELGYDIRKPGPDGAVGPRGSHCGAGAPRFNITTQSGATYFIGCNSPPATVQTVGIGWTRLRWGGAAGLFAFPASGGAAVNISALSVRKLSIVFDEGQDTAPDNFGLAVLDNVDVNGTLVGQGSGNVRGGEDDDGDDDGEGSNGSGHGDNGSQNGDSHQKQGGEHGHD
jgi:hypothetical protein